MTLFYHMNDSQSQYIFSYNIHNVKTIDIIRFDQSYSKHSILAKYSGYLGKAE